MRRRALAVSAVLLAGAAGFSAAGAAPEPLPWRGTHCRPAGALPPLLLIGENHVSEGSQAVKAELARLAARGAVRGGFEGARATPIYAGTKLTAFVLSDYGLSSGPESRLFGVESSLPHGLTMLYGLSRGGVSGADAPQDAAEAMQTIAVGALFNPALLRAWGAAQGSATAAERDLAARLLAAAMGEGSPAFAAADAGTLVYWTRRVLAAYVELVNREHRGESGRAAPFTAYAYDSPPPDGSPDFWARFIGHGANARAYADEQYAMKEWRDRDMAENIAEAYCAGAAEGRPVAVSLGAGHLPGVAAGLRRWARASRANIPLEVGQSYAPGEGNPAEGAAPGLSGSEAVLRRLAALSAGR